MWVQRGEGVNEDEDDAAAWYSVRWLAGGKVSQPVLWLAGCKVSPQKINLLQEKKHDETEFARKKPTGLLDGKI